MTPQRLIQTRTGKSFQLPLFLPVYQPRSNLIPIDELKTRFAVDGLIVNGFFLYKEAEVKKKLESGVNVHEYIGFDGLVMTDSGAFQGLKRPLYLANKKIVQFQDTIGADIVSPLDLISPPGDNFQTAQKKMISTNNRIREAKTIVKNSILAGVQQGGRFLELRKKSMEALMEMEVEYIAIGSLVPFFNKNHNMSTIIKIIRDAREIAGKDIPVHVYGAGDPVELPFLAALGVDIFDSSSYGHYANSGWYMTPYGALSLTDTDKIREFPCPCSICRESGNKIQILGQPAKLAPHNLFIILETIRRIREALENKTIEKLLEDILETHASWFPGSLLVSSWREYSG